MWFKRELNLIREQHNKRFLSYFAQLTWLDGAGNEITEGIAKTQELLSDGKRFTVKSTLQFRAQSEHHNTTFTCRAKSDADKVTKNAEIKIEVIELNWLFFLFACLIFFRYDYSTNIHEIYVCAH